MTNTLIETKYVEDCAALQTMNSVVKTTLVCVVGATLLGVSFISGMASLAYTFVVNPLSVMDVGRLRLFAIKYGRPPTTLEILIYCLFKRNSG